MATDWKSCKLGDVITLQRGYDLPNQDRREGNVPIVTSSGVTGFHDTAKAKGPGVVTGRYGTLGEVYFIKEDYWPHNTTLYVRDFKGNNPLFISITTRLSFLNRGVLFGAVMVLLLSAGFGAWVAQRVADPVARLTRATRQIASGRLDVRIVADTADELRRLVTDFNSMAATLRDQRAELGRTHELKAWADMSRQVAHDIKNPLTPIQLAAEHLQRVHEDRQRPLGPVFDQCITTVLRQVKLLRQIANDFSNFAASPTPTLVSVPVADLLHDVVRPYRAGLAAHTHIETSVPPGPPSAGADRTLLAAPLTTVVENALQAMPDGGPLRLSAAADGGVGVRGKVTGNLPDFSGGRIAQPCGGHAPALGFEDHEDAAGMMLF